MSPKRKTEETLKQIDLLKVKDIIVVEVEAAEARELRNKWESAFANDLTRSEKNQIHFNEMFWHIFSNEKVSALTDQAARAAFNQQKKQKCFLFYQAKKNAFLLDNAFTLNDRDIINKLRGFVDVYIVSVDFNWTYVVTHETDFGPYFCKK